MSPQLICCSYHKTGTSLLLHVMTKVSERLGLTLVNHYGLVENLEAEPDIVLLPHSLLRGRSARPYRAIRLIRDPRDILVSGYLYHLHCQEEWCCNTDLNPAAPIGWPQVDYSMTHLSEEWKRAYLERLGGKSYQRNLHDRPPADALEFELAGYTGRTFATMREWDLNGIVAMDVKLEAIMKDFDFEMRRIFRHFGFTAEQSEAAVEVARTEDLQRMDEEALRQRPQIQSRTISKWRHMLSTAQVARFVQRHGDLIEDLGYPLNVDSVADPEMTLANVWQTAARRRYVALHAAYFDAFRPRPVKPVSASEERSSEAVNADQADLKLWADGVAIPPIPDGRDLYRFIVPPDRQRLQLESTMADKPVGIRVCGITVETSEGQSVIETDDPVLSDGWSEPVYTSRHIWRQTNGSAELPWKCVAEPAIVNIYCLSID